MKKKRRRKRNKTKPKNLNHTYGRQRQPTESGGNAKGTLRYEQETQTWQCAIRKKIRSSRRTRRKEDNANNKFYKIMLAEPLTRQEYAHFCNMGKKNEEYPNKTLRSKTSLRKYKRRQREKKKYYNRGRKMEQRRSRPRLKDEEKGTATTHPRRKNRTMTKLKN